MALFLRSLFGQSFISNPFDLIQPSCLPGVPAWRQRPHEVLEMCYAELE